MLTVNKHHQSFVLAGLDADAKMYLTFLRLQDLVSSFPYVKILAMLLAIAFDAIIFLCPGINCKCPTSWISPTIFKFLTIYLFERCQR